jgi:hypothetical protein
LHWCSDVQQKNEPWPRRLTRYSCPWIYLKGGCILFHLYRLLSLELWF